MAQIDVSSLDKLDKQRNSVHEKVHTTYSVFEDNGQTYFQFDTYGASNREFPAKISQSIQLNKEAALHLINLMQLAFGLNGTDKG